MCIGDHIYRHTVAVSGGAILSDWPDKPVQQLVETDFSAILDDAPAVIIVGTGSDNVFPPRELVFALARRGIGLEVMNTPAAARTYNVLASEGRQVAAVFYL